jgi:uncharacterized membrane protein YjjB (DUF3815 family)
MGLALFLNKPIFGLDSHVIFSMAIIFPLLPGNSAF